MQRKASAFAIFYLWIAYLPGEALHFSSNRRFSVRPFANHPTVAIRGGVASLATSALQQDDGASPFVRTGGKTTTSPVTAAPYSSQSTQSVKVAFDAAVLNRFACKDFQRYDGLDVVNNNNNNNNNSSTSELLLASPPNPDVVQQALQCLDLARRSPSGFNTQPYKVVLVQSVEQKTALAKYCSGPNSQRVKDSDCTVVFLADRQVLRTLSQFHELSSQHRKERTALSSSTTTSSSTEAATTTTTPSSSKWRRWKMSFYIALFSSGYPLPRFLASPISLVFRFFFYLLSLISPIPLPTLSSAETWSIKNTMLVAMTYMLACTSRGLHTGPMEGFSAWGIRKVLKIPNRYAIPLIVTTGHAYQQPTTTTTTTTETKTTTEQKQDTATTTATDIAAPATVALRVNTSPRYPFDQVVFQDVFDNNQN